MQNTKLRLADKLLSLKDYAGEDEVVISTEIKSDIDALPESEWYRSRIPMLDAKIEGFEPGELIALSGPRKSGKTLLAQTFTQAFFDQDLGCLWFSYELTHKQFFRAFGCGKLPIFFMPQKNKAHDLEWVKDRIIESIAKFGVSVVFIDHLHFLFDIAKSRNASIEIGQVIRFLKGVAIDLNIVIVLLCHMNKIQPGIEPTDGNFRDSSFVASESDTGLIIWRVLNSPDQAWLKVCYSRRTGAWEEKIPLIKVDGLLREADLNKGNK